MAAAPVPQGIMTNISSRAMPKYGNARLCLAVWSLVFLTFPLMLTYLNFNGASIIDHIHAEEAGGGVFHGAGLLHGVQAPGLTPRIRSKPMSTCSQVKPEKQHAVVGSHKGAAADQPRRRGTRQ
jgi:hypothetical protein